MMKKYILNSLVFSLTIFLVNCGGHSSSNNLHMPAPGPFTTEDFTMPSVSIISPGDNATGVSSHPNIKIQFSKPVENLSPANVTLHEENLNGKEIPISVIISCQDNVYIFSPSVPLKPKTKYYVDLSSKITDTSENRLAFTDFDFTTASVTVGASDNRFTGKSYPLSCNM